MNRVIDLLQKAVSHMSENEAIYRARGKAEKAEDEIKGAAEVQRALVALKKAHELAAKHSLSLAHEVPAPEAGPSHQVLACKNAKVGASDGVSLGASNRRARS